MRFNRNGILAALTALCITAPLLYFAFNPSYLVQIFVQPGPEGQALLYTKSTLTRTDDNGAAFFDFSAALPPGGPKVVYLEIRPVEEPTFYRQQNCCRVAEGVAAGEGQLGSKERPLHQYQEYVFRLVESSGHSLMNGRIVATVEVLAGSSRWILLSIGLFASILQVVATVGPRCDPEASRTLETSDGGRAQ